MRLIDADALKEKAYSVTVKNEWHMHTSIDVVDTEDIDNAPTIDAVPRWIPCEERLPKLKTKCLITYLSWSGSPVIDIDSYDYDGEDGWFSYMEKVIAWMPLPKPYEGERSE